MNQYKQEYMTEFAFILGTMQKENIIEKFPPVLTENQDGIKVFNEFVEYFVDKFLSSKERDYEEFINKSFEDVKREFTNLDKKDKWKDINNIALKYYYELEPVKRIHLTEFEILNSINSVLDKPSLKTQERLLNIIYNVWLKDEEHTSESKISDEICDAFKNGDVSLKSLEQASSRDILECVYDGDFRILEKTQEIEELYKKLENSDYMNEESKVLIIDTGIIIGLPDNIINYLKDENQYLKEHEEEFSKTLIKNNKILIEEINEEIENDSIIGIMYSKENGSYELMEDEKIIERMDEILENEMEEEYEEEP